MHDMAREAADQARILLMRREEAVRQVKRPWHYRRGMRMPRPHDTESFSFWLVNLLNLSLSERLELLRSRDTHERLSCVLSHLNRKVEGNDLKLKDVIPLAILLSRKVELMPHHLSEKLISCLFICLENWKWNFIWLEKWKRNSCYFLFSRKIGALTILLFSTLTWMRPTLLMSSTFNLAI
ncbi:uncharacterized protein LOC143857499 [Tasmannia lanceolata]|uniref:uncharacterized protein LOC143857499 n=1 Tax=Tasmannia lanceolata TaxID=3420 RepID=UPI0040631A38